MRGWRGVLGGILALSVLYVITDVGSAGRLGGLFTDVSKLIANGMKRVSDPSLGGLRDFRSTGSVSSKPSPTANKSSKVPPIRGPR